MAPAGCYGSTGGRFARLPLTMLRTQLLAIGSVSLLMSACRDLQPGMPDFGVAEQLASARSAAIADVRYALSFHVPAARTDTVTGTVSITFTLSGLDQPLILDFRGDSASIRNVLVNGSAATPKVGNGHVVISASAMRRGDNVVSMAFASGDEALNRNADFMYALFVPDRASTAFPSFDQPDIKARYELSLDIPDGWRAVANGPEIRTDTAGGRKRIVFGETEPLSTYLFTFAAGVLQVETAVRDGRTYTMYHRETDSDKVARNREAIFDLHATAIRALESYTDIPYPFGKFAFLAVPSFQFGGMEHPGAVWYRASSLFLDESATQNQYLGRASLIAHETAHMWFGDLVTMRWFNDVWMKEVFANFMAAKIVQPSFPLVNHNLRFLLAHHATAYGVDRTLGANPIRQHLENLRQAGSLYGAIIYQKAPIVMQQLERLVGEDTFRDGLRTYLKRYAFANASWSDLIEILDASSPANLTDWSHAWVETAWRPELHAAWSDSTITVFQRDPVSDRKLLWQQSLTVARGYGTRVETDSVTLMREQTSTRTRVAKPDWILPAVDGRSYGRIVLDSTSRRALLQIVPELSDPMMRASATSALWESVLSGTTSPHDFLDLTMRAVERESDELLLQQQLGLLRSTYWRFFSDSARRAVAPRVESTLWSVLEQADGTSRKGALWAAIVDVSVTNAGVERLQRIWAKRDMLRDLPLSEQQYTALAEALVVRGVSNADSLLSAEAARITNPDRQARFAFVRPTLSARKATRDSAFRSFADVENRRRESWVLDGLRYLNHPLRAATAEPYIAPGLDLVDEIQRTGDIFFPLGWMNALLDGHQSVAAAEAVVTFLDANPTLQPRLRGKLLQAADDLFRSARVVHGWKGGPILEGELGR